ncbi:retrovirus-related pol polyprotein from transposon TNT 1-94 [Tanacetum coccineum]
MADMNIPANDVPAEQAPAIAPPIRTDDQILPVCIWVPIGKSNRVLDILKPQKSPISQQFWDTMCYDSTTGMYRYSLGIIHRSNIDYAKRIWEEFAQSIQTFLTDKKNLTTATRTTFTQELIHPFTTHMMKLFWALSSLLERMVGKYFGMPIPDALLTEEIKKAPYYGKYLEHVAKYQQYLDEEHGKAGEKGVTESPKATKVMKPKAAKQTKPSAPKASKVTKPADDKVPKQTSSQPPKSTSAPTEPFKKDQGKKCKPVKETADAPSPTKRSKAGKVTKKRMPKGPLQLVDEFVYEGVPEKEHVYGDEEANLQRALELSLKDQRE